MLFLCQSYGFRLYCNIVDVIFLKRGFLYSLYQMADHSRLNCKELVCFFDRSVNAFQRMAILRATLHGIEMELFWSLMVKVRKLFKMLFKQESCYYVVLGFYLL